ncbi:MAG: aminoglycoside phosphotransferase family protein [Nanoarchaeota archaeon]|nr:aminoglycoside phosphotransferase family protein [Nanoarchaeota archaeon]
MDKISYKQACAVAVNVFASGFKHIERGRNNWVFQKGEQILTIPRHERVKSYELRVAASRLLESHGIPVAEIIGHSPQTTDAPEYLIVRKVAGEHINFESIGKAERKKIHISAGEILARIHEINIEGYGRLDGKLKGQSPSWTKFADEFFEESLRRVSAVPNLREKYGKILQGEYEQGRNILASNTDQSLLHADFHPRNLLFDNGKVVAVLDLDIVTSGDTAWDTGHYCHTFNVDRSSGIRAFREGYGNPINQEAERLYSLMIWTRKIGSQARQRPEALKETLPELERILARREW